MLQAWWECPEMNENHEGGWGEVTRCARGCNWPADENPVTRVKWNALSRLETDSHQSGSRGLYKAPPQAILACWLASAHQPPGLIVSRSKHWTRASLLHICIILNRERQNVSINTVYKNKTGVCKQSVTEQNSSSVGIWGVVIFCRSKCRLLILRSGVFVSAIAMANRQLLFGLFLSSYLVGTALGKHHLITHIHIQSQNQNVRY